MQNCLLEVLLLLTPSGLLTTLVYLYLNAGKRIKQACHIILVNCLQWGESSPAKHGEAYFSAVVWPRILAITGGGFEKPHALHKSLGIHLARTFGATGKEQPSPPLHPAATARLLSCRALR